MIYVFHENQLIFKGVKMGFNSIPKHSYVYYDICRGWFVKCERSCLRFVGGKHLPKELKVMCLIYGIPLK
jgi:hypothetical protein